MYQKTKIKKIEAFLNVNCEAVTSGLQNKYNNNIIQASGPLTRQNAR